VWAGTFARGSQDLAAIAEQIVHSIADTLRARVGDRIGGLPAGTPATGTTNGEAFSAFLEGQRLLKQRGSGVAESVEQFEHAIALDPTFARAHAALATALQFYPHFAGTPPAKIRDRSMAAAHEALRLDSTLADAHIALGSTFAFDGEWRASDTEFRRAVALEPDNVMARQTYARFLIVRGEGAAALNQLDRARELERQSALISAWRSYAEFMVGHVDSALAQNAEAIRLDSTLLATTTLGTLVNLAVGRYDAARRLTSIVPPVGTMTYAPYVFAKLGDTTKANVLIQAMESNNPRPWFTDVARATVRLAVGDSAGALALLEQSARTTGAEWTTFIPLVDPTFDPIRRSPRFIALLRKAKLDQAVFTRTLIHQ
jgi:tetratricopeptide (TPR) repeat protein